MLYLSFAICHAISTILSFLIRDAYLLMAKNTTQLIIPSMKQHEVDSFSYDQSRYGMPVLFHEGLEEERKIYDSQIYPIAPNTNFRVPRKYKPRNIKQGNSKPRRVRESTLDNEKRKIGHWTTSENQRYHWFLEMKSSHFIERSQRRMEKIFKAMADFIGSREAEQCRSHHQKMQKKHKSFVNILLNLRQQYYKTDSPSPILDDLQQENIQVTQSLLSGSRLRELQEHLKHTEQEDRKSIESIRQEVIANYQQAQGEMEELQIELEEKDNKLQGLNFIMKDQYEDKMFGFRNMF